MVPRSCHAALQVGAPSSRAARGCLRNCVRRSSTNGLPNHYTPSNQRTQAMRRHKARGPPLPALLALCCALAAARHVGAWTTKAACGPTLTASGDAAATGLWAVGGFTVNWTPANATLSASRTGAGQPPVFANVPGAAFLALGCGPEVRVGTEESPRCAGRACCAAICCACTRARPDAHVRMAEPGPHAAPARTTTPMRTPMQVPAVQAAPAIPVLRQTLVDITSFQDVASITPGTTDQGLPSLTVAGRCALWRPASHSTKPLLG